MDRGRQRPHKPRELGPRVYLRGLNYWTDLRPFGGRRIVIRDPHHPDWPQPRAGATTDDEGTAREWAWAYVANLRETGTDDTPVSYKLGKAVEAYIKHRKTGHARATVSNDRSALNQLRDWAGKDLPTNRIRSHPGRRRAAGCVYLQDLINERLAQSYAVSTLSTWSACWAGFFQWLGVGISAAEIVLPEESEEDVRPWSDDEAAEIRKAATKVDRFRVPKWPSARLMVEFFFASGVRQQEGFAAERQRIRPAECTIRLVGQLDRVTNVIKPLKGKRARTTLILPDFWPHFKKGTGYVLGVNGKPLPRREQEALLREVLETAGLKDAGVGFHRFRHTYARWFIEQGGRLEELQKSLGHASISTTEESYGWLSEDTAAVMARGRIYGHPAQEVAQKRKTPS